MEKLDLWMFFWFLGYLNKILKFSRKSVKIIKNHKRMQIYEFLKLQLLGLKDSEKIWKNFILGPRLHFFWMFGVLRQHSEIFQKTVEIFKNLTKIQIYGFLVPQPLVLRDSEKILKKLVFWSKKYISLALGQNSEMFAKICENRHKS